MQIELSVFFNEHTGMIGRFDLVVKADHLSLNLGNLPFHRTFSPSLLFGYANDNIPAPAIVKVVSESTNIPVNRIGVPPNVGPAL
jgi:hypothetical protein